MEGLSFFTAPDPVQRGRVIGGAAGSLVGLTALAWLWKSHRVWGGILGFFVAGPIVGSMVGYAIALAFYKKSKESSAMEQSPSRQLVASVPITAGSLKPGDKVKGIGIMGGAPQAGVVGKEDGMPGHVYVHWADGSGTQAEVAKLERA